MRHLIFLLFVVLLTVSTSYAQYPKILTLKEQAQVRDSWLKYRIDSLLPQLMDTSGIDMWVIIAREYNEDPVIKTMLPATWLAARRRTILVFYKVPNQNKVEALAVARYNIGESFSKAWEPEKQPDQWKRLAEIIAERNPGKIGINRSEHFALADGLTASEYELLQKALPKNQHPKLVSAEALAIGWLETRTAAEMVVYQQIVSIAHHIIAEGFSEQVIQPGVTTTNDIVWWYREKVRELGLDAWFHPSVAIQRADPESFEHLRAFSDRPEAEIIMPGDLLHVDFGITYLGLNTDTQQHAYVVKPGETEAPAGLQQAFKVGNRLQDILTDNFITGRSGNQILKSALAQAKQVGIKATIYTHPIGYHGHAAGPTIGLWDQQGGVPHTGDYPLYANTAYSIELNAAVTIPEWNKEIRIMLEEDAFYDGKTVRYINGRQEQLLLIPRQPQPAGN
jgi:Xaa-Pro aminopeptidase